MGWGTEVGTGDRWKRGMRRVVVGMWWWWGWGLEMWGRTRVNENLTETRVEGGGERCLWSLYSSQLHSVAFFFQYIHCCYIALSPLLLLPLGLYLCLSHVIPFLPDVLCSSLFSQWWMMLCLSQHLCITFPILCMSKTERGRRRSKGGVTEGLWGWDERRHVSARVRQ